MTAAFDTATADRATRRPEALRFSAYLQGLSGEIKKARSGDKTRLRLLASGVNLLEDVGFREVSVEDVCSRAGLAKGTFYIYFESKDAFLIELCRLFVDFEAATTPAPQWSEHGYGRIRRLTEWYERTFALNVGALRCLVQMSEVSDEMRKLYHERNQLSVDRAMIILFGDAFPSSDDMALARLTFRVAAGMLDQTLFERHKIQVGPGRNDPDDPQLVLELHSLLLYRALYGRNPPATELERTLPLLAWPTLPEATRQG